MPTYTFVSKDLLNTAIIPDEPHHWIAYSTSTTSNVLGPKLTLLTPSVVRNTYGPALDGAIDWKEETFVIGGRSAKWANLKCKLSRRSGSAREWKWFGERFTVKYESGTGRWTAKSGSPAHADDAVFTVRKHRIFGADDPATIEFALNVSARDMVFLILVLIYSETKRQQRKEKVAVAVAG
ncbi:hypothetical protein LshimejAT787_0202500 [Lyophyllum shimeji]|uniref:Uncharacterized protein n=1 Tax=Lyophyllum shimeji TaxID=47721 RepID=A0A9P3PEU6_LYOSH|nr:hypothetical protein LshimejAT787_0202500 [Lyophyllum shimeji]